MARSRVDSDEATPVPIRQTEKVSELVAREILHEVARRKLGPGSMLPPEAEMLAKYQVGRSSLREALRLLEFQGLIRVKSGAGGGPVVSTVKSADFARMATMYYHVAGATIGELFEARLSLEPEMAAYAARTRDPAMVAALEENLARAQQIDASDDDSTHSSAARSFHDIILGMSGNRILDLLSRSIKDIYVDRVRDIEYPPDVRREIHAAHEEIAAAIMNGDDVLAANLMRAHLKSYTQRSVLANIPGLLNEVIDWR
jgi:GntR family transcriptional regulator, transcriptional repressor for pyruvate dehydrogenase complex